MTELSPTGNSKEEAERVLLGSDERLGRCGAAPAHNNLDCPPERWPESPRIAVQRVSMRIEWLESPRVVCPRTGSRCSTSSAGTA